MSNENISDATRLRSEISGLVQAAISSDVIADSGGGFVALMAKSNPNVQRDIPAAYEMYTLLSYYLDKLPVHAVTLVGSDVLLSPAILYDEPAGKLVALLPIQAGELDLIAYWIGQGIRSETVRGMAGVLALPFSIEAHDEVRHLIPEWFAAFYVDGCEDHCIPSLTLRSVTLDSRFGDWVAIALERMPSFGLPNDAASSAIRQKEAHK